MRPVPSGPCPERLGHQIVAEAIKLVIPLLQGAVLIVEIDGALDDLTERLNNDEEQKRTEDSTRRLRSEILTLKS